MTIEQQIPNLAVAGSTPAGVTNQINSLPQFSCSILTLRLVLVPH
jgi:hypothetical protein